MSLVYNTWGFTENLFSQTPLPADATGAELLVGRDEDVRRIQTRLCSPPKIVTVEGRNGIGKTSIVNVAAYMSHQAFLEKPGASPLLIPPDHPFQLDPNTDVDSFCASVFQRALGLLGRHRGLLEKHGRTSASLGALDKWLSHPIITGGVFGGTFGGVGASVGRTKAANTTGGFLNTGFETSVRGLLAELFPSNQGGGVVCVIDNLELMKTSKAVRELVEGLRDRVLTVPGLRWVLSGATGIVRGIGSTPRLSGFLHDPIEIVDIPGDLAGEILERRRKHFALDPNNTLPLSSADFYRLFAVLHGNIRDALSQADNFCTHVFEAKTWTGGSAPREDLFRTWLTEQCMRRQKDADRIVTERPWQLFDQIVANGGQCAPGDFTEYGFESPQAMRSNVLKLEEANLIQSFRDDDDNRRKTIVVTSDGWMVHFARSKGLGSLFAGG